MFNTQAQASTEDTQEIEKEILQIDFIIEKISEDDLSDRIMVKDKITFRHFPFSLAH